MEKASMNTKLAIDLREGTIQVEGEEAFVRFIYQDFKESLSKGIVLRELPPAAAEQEPQPKLLAIQAKEKKPRTKRTPSSDDGGKARPAEYRPTFNTNLNLAGLSEFSDNWRPANNAEKILIFAVFLRDLLKTEPCSADDIYTCFFTLNKRGKTKIPEAFAQAFHNTKSRTHYIEFTSLQEIRITIAGQNRYTEKLNQIAEEARK